jgi:hypothetical protein
MDLYIDGNIAQTFSPEGAARHFSRLLGVDSRSLRPVVSQERPHAFFVASSATQNARPSLDVNGQPLDYAISQVGTVVPQRMFLSRNPTDLLNMPIYFVHTDRVTLGLVLARSGTIRSERATLLGAGNPAPVGNGSTLYLRINVRIAFLL